MRFAFTAFLIAGCALASGCTSLKAPAYSPDYAAVDSLKNTGLTKAALGKAQPEDPKAKVNRISLRAANLDAADGTFAAYLERAMTADLREAGLYAPDSNRRIDLVLLRNDIDISGFSDGTGQIEVDLSLSDSGKTLLRKKYSAATQFESSFAGAIAIPKGQSEYPNLVRILLSAVYRDPAFLQAMRLP